MPLSGDAARRLAAMLASQADHHSVTADRLAGTADGVADLETAPVTHLADGEEPAFCFESHDDGVSVDDPEDALEPERGGVFLFTDCRVFLQLGFADGDETRSFPYRAVTATDFHVGLDRHRVDLRIAETNYHLWIPTAFDRDAISRAVEYVAYRRKCETPDRGAGAIDSGSPQTVTERLERLGDAKSRGLIDEEEFQRRKEELLDE